MVALSGNGWRLAPSLAKAVADATRKAPQRSIKSDGSIGDTDHQERKSDHNPDDSGDVLAVDITHDPTHGFDAHAEAERLRQRRDPRIKYVISNGRMFASYDTPKRRAWEWGTYVGLNAHKQHMHISVLDTPEAKGDLSPWFTDAAPPPSPLEPDMMPATSPAVCVSNGASYRFLHGNDDLLWVKIGSGNWAAFNGTGGRPLATLANGSSPSCDADPANGTVVVVITGTDEKLYESSRINGAGNWTAWVGIGGDVEGPND